MVKMLQMASVMLITLTMGMSVISSAREHMLTSDKNINMKPYTIDTLESGLSNNMTTQRQLDYYSMIDNATETSTMNNPITLDETEKLSNTIIRATFLGVINQEELLDSYGTPIYAFTRSSIRVDEVYSGNVKPGDVLSLFEPYYITQSNGASVLTHHENYYPTEIGKSYIWFLNERPGTIYDPAFGLEPNQNYYALSWCERSRYPTVDITLRSSIDVDNMSNQELDLSPNGSSYIYKKIYKEVINKYLKK